MALHPFGQIPTIEENGLTLFESGAIVLHLAQTRTGLLPDEPGARARAVAWMFAALTTVEPPIIEMSMAMLFERDRPWYADRQPMLVGRVQERLRQLSMHLGEAEWLDGVFSAADLLMVTVLRRAESLGLLNEQPNLPAYISRAENRPAYQRAFAEQLETFTRSQQAS